MNPASLSSFYREQLKEQILPFWMKHALDHEYGGYFSCLNRDGSVYDPHKVDIMMQGRISWTFAWMFNEFESNPEWLDFARKGVDFLVSYGFREDGRMYSALQQDGTPMLEPSIYHAELSSILGFLKPTSKCTNTRLTILQTRNLESGSDTSTELEGLSILQKVRTESAASTLDAISFGAPNLENTSHKNRLPLE